MNTRYKIFMIEFALLAIVCMILLFLLVVASEGEIDNWAYSGIAQTIDNSSGTDNAWYNVPPWHVVPPGQGWVLSSAPWWHWVLSGFTFLSAIASLVFAFITGIYFGKWRHAVKKSQR